MPTSAHNPYMPDELRQLIPTATPSDEFDPALGMRSLGRLIKPSQPDATWRCPDCGEPVLPVQMGAKWLPRAWCNCPGGAARKLSSHERWARQDQAGWHKTDRFHLLDVCDLRNTGMTFDSWRADTKPRTQALEQARLLARRLAEGRWAFWSGPYGCGKTHMAHAIASFLVLEHGLETRVINWTQQLRAIQLTWNSHSQDERALWAVMAKTRVLFLDDFDKTLPRPKDIADPRFKLPSSWAPESLYSVIDQRYAARLATVLIANQPWADVQKVMQTFGHTAADAVFSRFTRNEAIILDWAQLGITEYKRFAEPAKGAL